MAQGFTVSGEVRLDTGQAVQGTRQVRSELENLAKGGIAGFEAAQQKVIGLTKSVGELRTALLATTDPATQAALNAQLTDQTTRLRAAKT